MARGEPLHPEDMRLRDYWRSYYDTNRSAWPDMSKPAAAWDAFKLSLRVTGWLPMKRRP